MRRQTDRRRRRTRRAPRADRSTLTAAARHACAPNRQAVRQPASPRHQSRPRRATRRFRRASSNPVQAHACVRLKHMSATATPAMRQYLDAKQQHRDAILLFRMGDFYEMFYEDALIASRALELTLTSRSKEANGTGVPMCGVPFHAVDGYIARLVKKGFRVAICDQVEDPRKAKGIVKREVVRVVSPGTLTDASYLDAREPAFLMALCMADARDKDQVTGAALLDVSTGEFSAAEYRGDEGLQSLLDEIAVLKPRELVIPDDADASQLTGRWQLPASSAPRITTLEGWAFDAESARRALLDQLQARGLEGFGLERH